MPCHPNDPLSAKDEQERKECHSDDTPDNICLVDECFVKRRLGLIESSFDDGPGQGVKEGLDEYNAPEPAVQEVEGLIWDAGGERQY